MEIEPRRVDLSLPLLHHQLRQLTRTQHVRADSSALQYPDWTTYASQQHIRDMDFDAAQQRLWLATWGGVLCWIPRTNTCVRYTSEHGLLGNATRNVVVDRAGVVWAAADNGGLCCLSSLGGESWHQYEDSQSWTILCMTSRPDSGILVALKNSRNTFALAEITAPEEPLRLLLTEGLACREVRALLREEDTLWIGNAWGVHCYLLGATPLLTFRAGGHQVLCLAPGVGGSIWVGTSQGLYRLSAGPDRSLVRNGDWPSEAVFNVQVELDTANLWVATEYRIGRLVDDRWEPCAQIPSGRTGKLITAGAQSGDRATRSLVREGSVWAAGADGLWEASINECKNALALDADDRLCNAIQCLHITEQSIWAGTARGLYRLQRKPKRWFSFETDAPSLKDVRAIVPSTTGEMLWIASWGGGLHRVESDVLIPGSVLPTPLVALAVGADGTGWAASIDTIYSWSEANPKWEPIPHPVCDHIGGMAIQALCYQLAPDTGGAISATLWVGTSAGLFRYRPELGLWDYITGDLEQTSIQALTLDPITNMLWVGTSDGLFSQQTWQRLLTGNVQALAFSPPPNSFLWLSRGQGLEQWSWLMQGQNLTVQPLQCFAAANSGIASDKITAVGIRTAGGVCEIWIGSPSGLSFHLAAIDGNP